MVVFLCLFALRQPVHFPTSSKGKGSKRCMYVKLQGLAHKLLDNGGEINLVSPSFN